MNETMNTGEHSMFTRYVLLLCVMVVVGCDDGRINTHSQQSRSTMPRNAVPNQAVELIQIGHLANEIMQLRGAKETIEACGREAKWFSRDPRAGQRVFTEAVAAHNGCVTWLISSLGKGIDRQSMTRLIQQEDAARQKLLEWCHANEPRQPTPPTPPQPRRRGLLDRIREGRGGEKVLTAYYPTMAAIGEVVGSLLGIADAVVTYNIELQKLEAQKRQEEITRITGELKKCECCGWGDLKQ